MKTIRRMCRIIGWSIMLLFYFIIMPPITFITYCFMFFSIKNAFKESFGFLWKQGKEAWDAIKKEWRNKDET